MNNKFQFSKNIDDKGIISLHDSTYCTVIQVFGFEFDLLDEEKQFQQINILSNFFKSQQQKFTFFKINKPFNLKKQKDFINSLASSKKINLFESIRINRKPKHRQKLLLFHNLWTNKETSRRQS